MGKRTLDNWDGVTNRANTLVQNNEVPARAHQTIFINKGLPASSLQCVQFYKVWANAALS